LILIYRSYALEEFGKIILLYRSERVSSNTKRKIMYTDEFTNHEKKFAAALDYLQDNGYEKWYVINNVLFAWKG
jgi:AbiV family abortive infection protein